MKKFLLTSVLFAILLSSSAFAQLEVGVSYELRNEEPKSGFGLRVQKGILEALPMVDIGLRAHFSYFNEDNNVSKDGITYGGITNYDFGLAGYGGVSLGLLQPYVGLGLGSETVNFDLAARDDDKESNIYWNTFVGAKVTIIPLIKPFVEYRYSNKNLGDPDLADDQNRRFMVGVSLSF